MNNNQLVDLCTKQGATEDDLRQRELAAAERAARNTAAEVKKRSTLSFSVESLLTEGTVSINTDNILYGVLAMVYKDGDLQVSNENMREAANRLCARIAEVVNDFGKEIGLARTRQLH